MLRRSKFAPWDSSELVGFRKCGAGRVNYDVNELRAAQQLVGRRATQIKKLGGRESA